jgi:hypothetical protein
VERFHKTLRDEFFSKHTFTTIEEAQQALDSFVEDYNALRPHQSLGERTPAERFRLRAVEMPEPVVQDPVETSEDALAPVRLDLDHFHDRCFDGAWRQDGAMLVRAIGRPRDGLHPACDPACDTSPIAPRSLLGGRFASGSRSSPIVLFLGRVFRAFIHGRSPDSKDSALNPIESAVRTVKFSVPEIDPCLRPRPHVSAHSSNQGRGLPSAGCHVCGRVGCLMTETGETTNRAGRHRTHRE